MHFCILNLFVLSLLSYRSLHTVLSLLFQLSFMAVGDLNRLLFGLSDGRPGRMPVNASRVELPFGRAAWKLFYEYFKFIDCFWPFLCVIAFAVRISRRISP